MDNGPKPTRLWHWTGRKHYDRTISDRIESLKWLHPHVARSRKDCAQMFFLTLALGLTGFYSFGKWDPASYFTTTSSIEDNLPPDCTAKTGTKCPHSKPPGIPPCPCVEDDKCPMEWMKEEEKNRKRS